jgi:hypothetical protein
MVRFDWVVPVRLGQAARMMRADTFPRMMEPRRSKRRQWC